MLEEQQLQVLDETKDLSNFIKKLPKVELHIHLDGCMRPSTLYELALKKGFPKMPPNVESAKDFAEFLVMRDDGNLTEFIAKFAYMTPQVAGDREAIHRILVELCEDKKKQGVVYFEVRYAPQTLMGSNDQGEPSLSFNEVVETVNLALKEGAAWHHVFAKSILCCDRSGDQAEWAHLVAQATLKYRNDGVVGIDIAGDESGIGPSHPDDPRFVKAFQFAFENDIHRTAHAGEAGPAWNVKEAVETFRAQRIGHGYHVLDDQDIYETFVKATGVHLEECPYSSVKTGAFDVKKYGWKCHPLVRFFEDGVSFSINTDDTTVTGHHLDDEYAIVSSASGMRLPPRALVDAVKFAAEAAFVSGPEKVELKRVVDEGVRAALNELH